MTSSKIREIFLNYFKDKEHQIVPSAPIVVKNDPTLMFTNAGMNQFKDIFLGNEPAQYKRVADTQKCLRVSGKHNDLEEVGVDTYHHTMFEMLGNWSFGDYFKKEAIEWAWDLLTNVYGLDKSRLYVTVFEGDQREKLLFDNDAFGEWKKWIGEERILNGSKKDNFWEMGDTGPCGPCSEIHFDLRSDEERRSVSGTTLVNKDHPQVIEIWNLVFMEFNRKADGSLVPLPAKHVDTGMGFERLCRVIEGKSSNYDTDVFMPLISFTEKETGKKYGEKEKIDIAFRVLADHIRTISFAVLDGQLPSNTGAGYVIRRILRRAVRYYYSFLDRKEPLLHLMVPVCAEGFKNIFPEFNSRRDFVAQVILEEEKAFLNTLERGLYKLEKTSGNINGEFAFELYDTFGFPIDLTQLIAKESGREVDIKRFEVLLDEQKNRSRKATALETGDWTVITETGSTNFIGYDTTEAEVRITRYRTVKSKGKDLFQLVFDQTPFYAESGGQVGDTGIIENDKEQIRITDTQKENNLIIHLADKLPQDPKQAFYARVDGEKRKSTAGNHSATHLLHAALRQVLGEHVEQKGSLVNADYLRFDFSHFKALEKEELARVESLVNEKIRANIPLDERRNVPIEEAKKMGAMALFGEKYGDSVRVITFDENYSRELCGGIHVQATGNIGFLKIISEGAVAAGVRRIEAISGENAEAYLRDLQKTADGIKELLKSKDPVKSVEALLEERSLLQKRIEQLEAEKTAGIKDTLKSQVKNENGMNVLITRVDIPSAEQLKNLSFQLRKETENLFCVLGAVINDKPLLSVIISENLVKEKNLNAGNIIKEPAKEIRGGGGGQAFYATAGGSEPAGLDKALEKARAMLN